MSVLCSGVVMPKVERDPIDRNNINTTKSYTVLDVAHCVGWTTIWLRRLIREGRVKAFRPNGHEWRIPGEEVKRICETLKYRGRLPKASVPDQVNVIEVTPEQMQVMDPNWKEESAGEPPQDKPKGFWEQIDENLKESNPYLYGGDE